METNPERKGERGWLADFIALSNITRRGTSHSRLCSVNMRLRSLAAVAVALAAIVTFAGRRFFSSAAAPQQASISSTPSQSYLVILGVGDRAETNWDGSITASGATILGIQGWRFSATDTILGTSGWKLSTRPSAPGPQGTSGPVQENGIIV